MKRIAVGITCLLLVVGMLPVMAMAQDKAESQNSALVEEAKRLNAEVVRLYREGKFNDAIVAAKRALEIWEKERGKESQQVASSLLNLAEIYSTKKSYPEAETYYRRALKVEEKRLGENNHELCRLLIKLGWMQHVNSHASEAEDSFKRAIALIEKQRGADHSDVADALSNLATFYQKIGKPKNSLPIYERMIAIREKSPDKDALAETLEYCHCALNQSGKPAEASAIFERVVALAKSISGEPTPVSGGVLQGTATVKKAPYYPNAAKAERLSGSVYVKVVIDEAGNVIDAKVLCGPDLLAGASLEAARSWRFKPTELEGKPIKVQGILTFNFTLQ